MVSAIELGKSLSKLMIPIALLEKFSSETFITSIKVIYMTSYKLRIIHSIRLSTCLLLGARDAADIEKMNKTPSALAYSIF